MRRRLILIGGSAGSGKTSVARTLADDLGAGWLQLDTVWIAMKAAVGEGSPAYRLLDVAGRMQQGGDADDEVLAAHVAASRAVCEVLPAVLTFELDARPAQERHLRMNRQIWRYGAWVCEQARTHNLPVLDPMPFATLTGRTRVALAP